MSDEYNPSQRPGPAPAKPEGTELDLREQGAPREGRPQVLDRRLFMQLLVFRVPPADDTLETGKTLADALMTARMGGVIYEDVNDPRGMALLTLSESPADFVTKVRPLFREPALRTLELRPDMTMFGRTYSSGFEQNLEFWLCDRPRETVWNEKWPWAVWYPLRRKGEFERVDRKERGGILREHADIGKSYGEADHAHDVRLACHGLDQGDNEFVIGLIGKDLYPLSHVIQAMRRTRQTSEFMEKMGPFFVGHVAHRIRAR